jgi:hypothetical protein
MEMLQEAKSEIERMGPSPAVLGRDGRDASGRALLARQQSGLVELANLYGGLEDWELRVYRQCWARAKQFWKAPQFIRVTDDENSPKFVGLNQPVPGGPPTVGVAPASGLPQLQPGVLGYKNVVAEMDVDIEIDTQPDTGTIQQEAFTELMRLVSASPIYQQQISLKQLIQLSPVPHKRSVLESIDQAAQQQQAIQQAQQQLAMQGAQAKVEHVQAQVGETQARTQLHGATGFAKALDSLTYSHAAGADHIAAGLEKGIDAGQQQQQAQAADQAQMQTSQQAASAQQAQADQSSPS